MTTGVLSTVLPASTGAISKSSISMVSTRNHDNIHVQKHSIGDDEFVNTMRYVELIDLMGMRDSTEEDHALLLLIHEVGCINDEEFEEIQEVSFLPWIQAKMSGNESKTSETPSAARAMPPLRAMTSCPRDTTTKSEWDKMQATNQLAKLEAMFGPREPDATVLLAFKKACVARDGC